MASNSVTDVNVCVSASGDGGRSTKKQTSLRQWVVKNQIGISLTILTMLFAVHNLYPSLRTYTTPFLHLPHYQPAKGTYVQGMDDICYLVTGVLMFTAVRAATIEWLFEPIAHWCGLKGKPALRFAEQGWLVVYYFTFWSYGTYIWCNSSYWLDFRAIWRDWPRRDIPGVFKQYCLLQLSFWLQQIFVINIEQKRKDHYQMLTHHIVTSTLLGSAYVYGFYNVANVVLCIMDIVDYLLPFAKMLKYLGYEVGCTIAFGVFLGVWVIARHAIYMTLWWSIYKNVPDVMAFGCYSGTTGEMLSTNESATDNWSHLLLPFQNIDGPICMSPRVKWIFLIFLLCIQVLSLIWFGMIMRVAVNVLRRGQAADDTRSDDEEEEAPKANGSVGASPKVVSENSGTENGWPSVVISSGATQNHHPVRIRTARGRVSLSDHHERRALLGRIGCDKPS